MLQFKLEDEEGRQAALERYDISEPRIEPFERITSLVKAVLGVPMCAVTFIDGDRQRIHTRQGFDVAETPRSASFCQHTIASTGPLVVPDARRDLRFSDNPFVTEGTLSSYLGVPLTTPDGYNLGALCAMDTVARQFDPAEIELLARFAALVVEELELRTIARYDALTGAVTRRTFVEESKRVIDRFARYARPGALLLFDIDHFKSINDTFGHPAGDDVLRRVAQVAEETLRPSDMLGRIGGEEFGILLPETERADARACAERLRQAIASLHMPELSGRGISASFGLSCLSGFVGSPEGWIAEADAALYMAKRSGRNRCVDAGALDEAPGPVAQELSWEI
ncbi:diguanylate cyclase [Novosphingobium sp. PC22D]|uniref:sensor domain-containing diguanylate cyclase n=1 Tax=Novosphingobium sp. PC22D TaxID=1962403 RepID=UPI000BF0E433|nr:sensor domain-containing diguanylate cyclase [Novosphingobium sp. PC22D]PEQ14594.1 diguanylate cyclase [Novosphingobium sp. PC22D]